MLSSHGHSPGHNDNCRCPKFKPPKVREGTGPDVFALVSADMAVRASVGMAEYGVPLRAFNGRDAMWDAYEEALDLAVYLRQCIAERDVLASRSD